jgi:multisubunit Na+/H+ antiporter MnhG subunit
VIAWYLVFAGVAVVVFSTGAATIVPKAFDRLHLLAVTTSVGSPLIAVGLAIISGWNATTASLAVITGIMVVTGPAMSAATGRLVAEQKGMIEQDRPA